MPDHSVLRQKLHGDVAIAGIVGMNVKDRPDRGHTLPPKNPRHSGDGYRPCPRVGCTHRFRNGLTVHYDSPARKLAGLTGEKDGPTTDAIPQRVTMQARTI